MNYLRIRYMYYTYLKICYTWCYDYVQIRPHRKRFKKKRQLYCPILSSLKNICIIPLSSFSTLGMPSIFLEISGNSRPQSNFEGKPLPFQFSTNYTTDSNMTRGRLRLNEARGGPLFCFVRGGFHLSGRRPLRMTATRPTRSARTAIHTRTNPVRATITNTSFNKTERMIFSRMIRRQKRLRQIISGTLRTLLFIKATPAASTASADPPAAIAIPTSDAARAGPSLTPSPTIPTSCFCF